METPDRVVSWLNELDSKSTVDAVNELDDGYEPGTPPRRLSQPQALSEASPFNTSGSGHSIFDTPLAKQQPPETIRRTEQGTGYESDITSIDGDQLSHCQKSASLATYDPSSQVGSVSDPSKPQFIWLSSCLQCVLANLPCSLAVPACSRCKRNGHASTCLLQRRWYGEDIASVFTTNIRLSNLLRLRTDDDETWKRKCELADELLNAWELEQDKKNWVLPSIEGVRGHYQVLEFIVKQMHPEAAEYRNARNMKPVKRDFAFGDKDSGYSPGI